MMISIESVTEYFVNQILIFLVCDEMRLHGMYGWYVCVTSIFFLDTNLNHIQMSNSNIKPLSKDYVHERIFFFQLPLEKGV